MRYTCGNVISSFELLGAFRGGIMKYICSICRTLEISLIQIIQVIRSWGCSCQPEASKLHTWVCMFVCFPHRKHGCYLIGILPRSRIFKISNSQLFSTYLSHGGTWCYRAGGLIKFRMLLHFYNVQTQKVSWRPQQAQVMSPIDAAWDSGYFIIALHQKNVVCCTCSSAGLSLLDTILFPVHCKHTHDFFFQTPGLHRHGKLSLSDSLN